MTDHSSGEDHFDEVGMITSESGPWAAADIELSSESGVVRTVTHRPPASFTTGGGLPIRLASARAAVERGDEATVRGRWAQLTRDLDGVDWGEFHPGPHVQLTARVRGVRSGSQVRVVGIHQRALAADPDYRSAKGESEVVVSSLAPASAAVTGTPAADPVDRGLVAWTLFVGGMATISCAMILAACLLRETVLFCLASSWWAFTATLGWRVASRRWGWWHTRGSAPQHRWLPEPVLLADGESARVEHGILSIPVVASVPMCLLALPFGARASHAVWTGEAGGTTLAWVSVAAASVAALALWLEDRKRTGVARRFVRDVLSSDGWARASGRLVGRLERTVLVSTKVVGVGRGRSTRRHFTETQVGDERVKVGDTEIDPSGIVWGGGLSTRRVVPSGKERFVSGAGPSSGALVAKAGAPSGVWAATGPESLLLYVARGADAASELRRVAWAQRMGALPLLVHACVLGVSVVVS
ncbi:MAG: hypothetical protein SangKO_071300 [Sandaracinaceae bacterium]